MSQLVLDSTHLKKVVFLRGAGLSNRVRDKDREALCKHRRKYGGGDSLRAQAYNGSLGVEPPAGTGAEPPSFAPLRQ